MTKPIPFCEPAQGREISNSLELTLLEDIDYHMSVVLTGNINPIIKRNMAISLTNFVVAAIEKFQKGQQEHGGDIRDRDLKHEITQETIDLFWYNEAQKWPSHLK